MKSLKLVFISIIIVIFVIVSSCSSPTATPTGTVNAYLNAIAARNAQTTVSYEAADFVPGTHAQRIEQFESIFEEYKSYTITNRNVVLESQDDTNAAVSVTFDYSVTNADDNITEDSVDTVFYLTKVDGKWLLSGSTQNEQIEEEARRMEKITIQMAVLTMIIDNKLGAVLPAPVNTTPTNNMAAFPDNSTIITQKVTDPDAVAYQASDQGGYYLYEHDIVADNGAAGLVNYVTSATSTYYYTCDSDGTVHQWADAAKTGGEITD